MADELIAVLRRHLGYDPPAELVEFSEQVVDRFHRESLDEWGTEQPMSYRNEWNYHHASGPNHLMDRVLSDLDLDSGYERLGQLAPPLLDRQKLLDDFEPAELAEMSDEEVLVRNAEALFYDACWDVWDHRFDGNIVVVVAHTPSRGIQLKRFVHPSTHYAITHDRFPADRRDAGGG